MSIALDLTRRRLLVVGASSGIGRAVGCGAARAGARVALAARRRQRLEEAAAEAGNGALALWMERRLLPVNTMMPVDVCAESVLTVLGVRGYVDDIAIMPRTRDPAAG